MQARGQHRHRLCAVAVLRPVVLALDHEAARQMRDAHGGIGLVHVLAARTGRAERIDAEVRGTDRDVGDGIGFRQYGNRARGSVDASLRFRFRDPLHAVSPGLELELRVHALSGDARDHLLESPHVAQALRNNFHLPAIAFCKARVHAEEIAGEQRRLVAAGSGANFQKHVALVVRIPGQQHALKFLLQPLHRRLRRLGLVLG